MTIKNIGHVHYIILSISYKKNKHVYIYKILLVVSYATIKAVDNAVRVCCEVKVHKGRRLVTNGSVSKSFV